MPAKQNYPLLIGLMSLVLIALFATAAARADTVSRSFDVRAGGQLEIDTDRGKIDVRTSATGRVEIEVVRNGSRAELLDVAFEQHGDRISVTGDWPNDEDGWHGGERARIEFNVSVPRRFDLELSTSGGSIVVADLDGKLRARTSGGRLDFGNILGEVEAHTSGGSIELESGGADVRLHTSGGSIRVGPVSGDLNARSSGGSIKIEEVAGAVDASTSGGTVQATLTAQPSRDCNLSTSGGSVILTLADGIALDIDASAGGGGVRSDFPIDGKTKDKRRLRGPLNGGGPRMRLHTSGGSVRIRDMR